MKNKKNEIIVLFDEKRISLTYASSFHPFSIDKIVVPSYSKKINFNYLFIDFDDFFFDQLFYRTRNKNSILADSKVMVLAQDEELKSSFEVIKKYANTE